MTIYNFFASFLWPILQHVKTEEDLHCKATELLSVVQESVGDVNLLHSKLERKIKVDMYNKSVQDKFKCASAFL